MEEGFESNSTTREFPFPVVFSNPGVIVADTVQAFVLLCLLAALLQDAFCAQDPAGNSLRESETKILTLSDSAHSPLKATSHADSPAFLPCSQVQFASVEKNLPIVTKDRFQFTPLLTNIVLLGTDPAARGFIFVGESATGEMPWRREFEPTNGTLFPEYSAYFTSNTPLYFIAHGLTPQGSTDSFVALSLSADGATNWINSLSPVYNWSYAGRYRPDIIGDSRGYAYLNDPFDTAGQKAPRRTNIFPLTRIDPRGQVLWTTQADASTTAVAVGSWGIDQNDNLVVAGIGGHQTNATLVIEKFDADGASVWTRTQALGGDTGGAFIIYSVTFGPAGEVLVAYGFWGMETGPATSLKELGPDGAPRWIFDTGAGQARRLTFDSKGNLFVFFSSYYQGFVLGKIDPLGRLVWKIETLFADTGFSESELSGFRSGPPEISANGELTVRGTYPIDTNGFRGVALHYLDNAVEGAPVILNLDLPNYFGPSPRVVHAIQAQPFTTDIPVDGEQPLTFQWLHDSVPVINATNHVLFLPDLESTDSGLYTLLVTNRLGCALSDSFNLVVLPRPFLVAHGVVRTGTTNRFISLDLLGPPSTALYLEHSTNLLDWQQADLAVTDATGKTQISLQLGRPNATREFYRVKFDQLFP